MYKRMYQAYRLEVAQGVFKEVGKFEGDGNFLRMLRVSQKLLTAIGDDDRYYREWIGLLIILAKEEYDKWLKDSSRLQKLSIGVKRSGMLALLA